jgi:hypothetical protein
MSSNQRRSSVTGGKSTRRPSNFHGFGCSSKQKITLPWCASAALPEVGLLAALTGTAVSVAGSRAAGEPALFSGGPLTLPGPASHGVSYMTFSHDDRFLAAGDGNGCTCLSWRTLASTLDDPGRKGVAAVAVSRCSKEMAAANANGACTYGLASFLTRWPIHPVGLASAASSPSRKYLAAGDVNCHVCLGRSP